MLLEQRQRARSEGDYARADAIRDQLHAQGWDVRDTATGAELVSRLETVEVHDRYAGVPARYGEPDAVEFSLCVAMHGWPEDIARLLRALSDYRRDAEMVVVDVRQTGVRTLDFSVAPEDPRCGFYAGAGRRSATLRPGR